MKNFIVAAQLYTLRELLADKTKEEIFDVLKQVKDMGYDAVQISGVGNVDMTIAKNFQEVCKDLELDICVTHLGFEFLENNIDWVIEYHKMWDCGFVGIGSMPTKYQNKEGTIEFARLCNEYGKKLKESGIMLVYHNHRFEYEKYDGKTLMDILFDNFDPEYVEFELDTHWVQSGGADPVKWIYKVDGRMTIIHFKDFRVVNNEQQFAEIGEGNLEWDDIVKACEDTAVKYAAIEQDGYTDDPLKSLNMSIDFLRANYKQLK